MAIRPSSERLLARRLTAQQAAALWKTFYDAHGPEVMRVAYGWESPADAKPATGERVWSFHPSPEATCGWGSVALSLRDPNDDTALLSIGVFPAFERRGYRHQIYDFLCAWARRRGATFARIVVFKDNEAQYERTLREAHEGDTDWIYAGDVWYPAPGYGIFIRDLTGGGQCDQTKSS